MLDYSSVKKLVTYGIRTGMLAPSDEVWAVNQLLEVLCVDSYEEPEEIDDQVDLPSVLNALCDLALQTGAMTEDSIVYRDLFDTKLMGAITPMPSQVQRTFTEKYRQSPQEATDWYYKFSQDTNYIRRDRIAKDVKWVAPTE